MLRNLAGLKGDSAVGFLPVVPSNPQAEHALHDLRAIALRHLDNDFLAAIRPVHLEPAYTLDAGIDAIGYAAFVQSRFQEYVGIRGNLRALQDFLLRSPAPDVVNYDLQAFLVTLRAVREAVPALAAETADLAPLLTEERIFAMSRRPPQNAKILRRIYGKRAQFTKFLGSGDLNDVVAGFFPLLHEEEEDTVFTYLALKERLRAARGTSASVRQGSTDEGEDRRSKRKARDPRRKARRPGRPSLNYYRPAAPTVIDRVTRATEFRIWTVPAAIKDLYEQHGRELTKTQRSWLRFAREAWPKKSTMRWVLSNRDGLVRSYLAQKIIDPISNPPDMDLIEEAQEEEGTIASLLLDVSCSMQVEDRYELAYMIADRLGDFLTKGEVSTEIVGHTTTSETVPGVIGRNRPIHYILFKLREEPHNLSTVHRLCSIMHTGMQYFGYDGEATMWCYQRLKKTRAKHRIMFVVTDGDPSGTYVSKKGEDISYFTARHFRDVVAGIEAEGDVELVGVSIKSDVSRIFSRSIRVDSIEDIYKKLSPFTLKLLRELNDQQKPPAGSPLASKMVAHRKARVAKPR